ncbi:MAG: type II toxin-antitoxin system YhaV family toxin [Actinomycetes bacterium]
MQRHGWHLLFHECLIEQLRKLEVAVQRAKTQDPRGFESNANVKLFNALARLLLETAPSGPDREEYRQGDTMGAELRHWRRARIGRRFRLFFRFDSRSRIIIFARVNADDWATLRAACTADWKEDGEVDV